MSSIRLVSPGDIRKLRKALKITQKKLAEKAGVSQSLISRIENNDIDPRLSTIKKIIDVLSQTAVKRVAKEVMHSPVITVDANDVVRNAVDLMKKYGISQIPVLKDRKVIGIVRETTIIDYIIKKVDTEKIFAASVFNVMEKRVVVVSPATPIGDIVSLLSQGEPALLVVDNKKLIGIITKIDVIFSAIDLKNIGG